MDSEVKLTALYRNLAGKIGVDSAFDITRWYGLYRDGSCPNCGRDFKTMNEMENVYPHFTGACKVSGVHSGSSE